MEEKIMSSDVLKVIKWGIIGIVVIAVFGDFLRFIKVVEKNT
jgi:hypothetical protein